MLVWVLTYEVNEYDQCGKYFQAAFSSKPNYQMLSLHGVPMYRFRHVMNGGGRVDDEYKWFTLTEITLL